LTAFQEMLIVPSYSSASTASSRQCLCALSCVGSFLSFLFFTALKVPQLVTCVTY